MGTLIIYSFSFQNCNTCASNDKKEAIRIVLLDHQLPNDSIVQKQKNQIIKLQNRVNELQNEVYALRRQVKRKGESMDRIKEKADQCIEVIKKSKIVRSSKSTQTADLDAPETGVQRFAHEIQSRQKKAGVYSEYIMDFAFRLFYISPKGFNFVRSVLEQTLPHPCTFSRWKKPVDTRPGLKYI